MFQASRLGKPCERRPRPSGISRGKGKQQQHEKSESTRMSARKSGLYSGTGNASDAVLELVGVAHRYCSALVYCEIGGRRLPPVRHLEGNEVSVGNVRAG